jgi:hypothetical protein
MPTFSAFSGNDRSFLYPARPGNVKQTTPMQHVASFEVEIMVP